MSPAFLRPPKTKIRGLDLKYFPGQLISALPSQLFQSSGSTGRWTPRLPEEHWEALPSTPLAPLAPHTDLAPRVIALFHLTFLKKKFIFPRHDCHNSYFWLGCQHWGGQHYWWPLAQVEIVDNSNADVVRKTQNVEERKPSRRSFLKEIVESGNQSQSCP